MRMFTKKDHEKMQKNFFKKRDVLATHIYKGINYFEIANN